MTMSSNQTPASGWPIVDVIQDLKHDLRAHVERDERELAAIRTEISATHEHVGKLRQESASNTAVLGRIEQSLQRRAQTEDFAEREDLRFTKRKRLKMWGSALTVSSAGLGYLIHWLLG